MKETVRAINKVSALTKVLIHNVKSITVLSKQSLIHPARSCLTWQAGQTASSPKFNHT